MRTQIQIHDSFIELVDEPNLNITKSVADIKEPETRTADRTLTIDIPGSHTNNKLFSFIFNVNMEITNTGDNFNPEFDPNKRAYILINVDTIQQFVGYCQLTDIVIDNEDKITYKIVAYGQMFDLISTVGQSLLTDLDMSALNHTYTYPNISGSWSAPLGAGYYYPMIDYGTKISSTDYANWNVEDFKPAIYTKEILDKIFEEAGFTYTSTFLNSTRFKSLVVPFSNEKLVLSQAQVEDSLFYAGRTSNQTIPFNAITPVIFDDDATPPFFDNNNNYDSTTGVWTIPNKGVYNLISSITATISLNSLTVYSPYTVVYGVIFAIKRNGLTISTVTKTVNFPAGIYPPGSQSTSATFQFNLNNAVFYAGDLITIEPVEVRDVLTWTAQPSAMFNLEVGIGATFYNGVVNEGIFEGMTVDMNAVLPKNFLQRDFITGLTRAYNLYFEPDPNNDTHLFIEPRIDFYTDEVEDWTQKLDNDKEVTVKPMAFLDAKRYTFTYKEDKDYYNQSYKDEFGYLYGRRFINIDNDFIKNDKIIEVPFAPTPLTYVSFNDRILSNITFVDQNGQVNYFSASLPRMLFVGLRTTANTWNFKYNNGGSSVPYSTYPYAGHLDSPTNSTFDLNFGMPQKIYYSGSSVAPTTINYTNQNLYNIYWNEDIIQRADKNSRVLEAYFYLKPVDILTLSFRKLYFIRSQYYRLIEMVNYDPVNVDTTLCRFARYIDVDAVTPNTTNTNGGGGTFDGQDLPVFGDDFVFTSGGNTVVKGSLVSGTNNNNFGDVSGLIVGDFNTIGSGSTNISILSSSGVIVSGGVNNVTVIGSQDLIINESDVAYINNVRFNLMGGNVVIITSDYITANTDYFIEADATAGNITVTILDSLAYRKEISIIKNDLTGNTVTIQTESLTTIATLLSNGDAVTLFKSNSGIFIKSKN